MHKYALDAKLGYKSHFKHSSMHAGQYLVFLSSSSSTFGRIQHDSVCVLQVPFAVSADSRPAPAAPQQRFMQSPVAKQYREVSVCLLHLLHSVSVACKLTNLVLNFSKSSTTRHGCFPYDNAVELLLPLCFDCHTMHKKAAKLRQVRLHWTCAVLQTTVHLCLQQRLLEGYTL